MRTAVLNSSIWILVLTLAPSRALAQAGPPEATPQGATGPRSTARLVLKGPVPRTPDGKPDLRGFWNAPPLFSSNILEEHLAGFGIQAGKSVVVDPSDGRIPYQPWALAARDEHRQPENAYLDNEGRCILSGLPRIMLFTFDVKYSGHDILLFFDYIHATRVIHMDRRQHIPADITLWMGDSIGRWDGDTLVVDSTNFNGRAWFALGGDFMSDAGHIVERFRMSDANTLQWQATITDPKVFTGPWTMQWSQPYVRGSEEEVLDDDCHEGNADLVHLKANYDAARAAASAARTNTTAAISRAATPPGKEVKDVREVREVAQGRFSGTWLFDQQASGRGAAAISFPSEMLIVQTPAELHVESTTVRQDAIAVVYKLDGAEGNVPGPAGITTKAKATFDGETLVIASKRTFTSPAGDITADIHDVYSVAGNVLIIERKQTINGISSSAKAVYNRASS